MRPMGSSTTTNQIVPLDPHLCEALDAIGLGIVQAGQLDDFFERQHHLLAEMDYFICDNDLALHQQAQKLLDQLYRDFSEAQENASDTTAIKLSNLAFQFTQTVHLLTQNRQKQYFLGLPALDQLVVAGVAFLQQRADDVSVLSRSESAWQEVTEWASCFEQVRTELFQETLQSVESGFARIEAGFDELEAWENDQGDLKEAISYLKYGGELVEPLTPWRSQQRSFIPLVGEKLRAWASQECSEKKGKASLKKLEAYWSTQRHRLFVPLKQQDDLITAIDQTLERLRHQPENRWETYLELETDFRALQQHRFDLNVCQDTAYIEIAQILRAAWLGGIPAFQLLSLADSCPDALPGDLGPIIRQAVLDHLRGPQPDRLLEALEAVLEQSEAEKPVVLPFSTRPPRSSKPRVTARLPGQNGPAWTQVLT